MKVKLGFGEYGFINKKPSYSDDDEPEFDGVAIHEKKQIWVTDDKNACKEYKIQVLFHEITHALLHDLGYCGLSNDEGFVDGLSKEIYALFSKNDMSKLLQYAER